MKANIHRLIILGVIISITFGTHAQGILLQKKINRIHRLLENEEIQDVGMQLSKLDEKYPYHPLVYWYKLRYHLLLGEDTQQYYPLLDEAKRLYSLQSPKEKNLIQKFFTLSDLKEMYLQLDEEMLDNIRENCNKKDADFFKKNRGESPQFNQFIEIYENCELNKILEYPTVEKLNEFMQKTNNDLRHKAKKIVDSLLYHNLKKNYRFQTALKFYFDYPNHPQKKTIEEDLFYWYTLDGVLDSFIKYVLLFESSPLREDALKYVILLKNYNNSDVQEARPLTIEQDSLQSIINIKNNYLDFYQINKQWNVLLADGNKYLLPQNLGEFKGGFPCDSSIPYFIFEKKEKQNC